MKRIWFTITAFVFFISPLFADQASALFEKANDAFFQKKYAEAVGLYEQLLTDGYQSAELEYNLGNAYFRQNNLGQATLHFERAYLLDPHDEEVRHNLAVVRDRQVDEFSLLPKFFLTKLWEQMRLMMPATAWGILALVIWWGGMAGLGIWLFGKSRSQKKKGFFYGLMALAVSLLPLALALSRADLDENSRHAIVLSEETTVRSAPDAEGAELLKVHEGLKVKLLDEISGWWQVELPDGEKGWLNGGDVERI